MLLAANRAALVALVGALLARLQQAARLGAIAQRIAALELAPPQVATSASRARVVLLLDALRTLVLRVDTRDALAHSLDFLDRCVGELYVTWQRVELRDGLVHLLLRATQSLVFPPRDAFESVYASDAALDYGEWHAAMRRLYARAAAKPSKKKADASLQPLLVRALVARRRSVAR